MTGKFAFFVLLVVSESTVGALRARLMPSRTPVRPLGPRSPLEDTDIGTPTHASLDGAFLALFAATGGRPQRFQSVDPSESTVGAVRAPVMPSRTPVRYLEPRSPSEDTDIGTPTHASLEGAFPALFAATGHRHSNP